MFGHLSMTKQANTLTAAELIIVHYVCLEDLVRPKRIRADLKTERGDLEECVCVCVCVCVQKTVAVKKCEANTLSL